MPDAGYISMFTVYPFSATVLLCIMFVTKVQQISSVVTGISKYDADMYKYQQSSSSLSANSVKHSD